MPVISNAGREFTPYLAYPGVTAHFRRVNGRVETFRCVLTNCFLFHREVPCADSSIFFKWATEFCKETEKLRKGGTYNLIIINGYQTHLKFSTLSFFWDDRVILITLPSRTSHELQPLDATVFGVQKYFLQSEFLSSSRVKKRLNAFYFGACIHNTYGKSFVSTKIHEGFRRMRLQSEKTRETDVSELEQFFQ